MKWLLVLLAWGALAEDKPSKPGAAMNESLAKQRAAMALQQEAARKQAELLPLEPLIHHDMEPAEPECDPIGDAAVNPIIESAAKANQLQPEVLRAMMRQESQFYPCAVSEKGAQGLMQLMPSTSEQFAVRDVFDPQQNVDAGAKFLKQLFDKYKGNLGLALAAYNAGPAVVDEAKGIPDIPETRSYVDAILRVLVKKADAGAPPP
jgi:Transglycosylase SLT domain